MGNRFFAVAVMAVGVSSMGRAEPSDNPFAGLTKVPLSVAGRIETCIAVAPASGQPMALDGFSVFECFTPDRHDPKCTVRTGYAAGTLRGAERVPEGFAPARETFATGSVMRYLKNGEEFIGSSRIFDAKRLFCIFANHEGFRDLPTAALGLAALDCGETRAKSGHSYGVILYLRIRKDRGNPQIVPAGDPGFGMTTFTVGPEGDVKQVD